MSGNRVGTLGYESVNVLTAYIKDFGGTVEEVYWKSRMYKVVSKMFRQEGYTFDEAELDSMINSSYNGLLKVNGFPERTSITDNQIAKILLDACKQVHFDRKTPLDEKGFDNLYDNYKDELVEVEEEESLYDPLDDWNPNYRVPDSLKTFKDF